MPTEELTTCTQTYQLSTASGQMKVGQRLTVSNRTIYRLSFEMYKNSPGDITTKKLYYEIRDPNDGYSLIQSKDTGFELLLNGSYAWYEATLDTPQYLNKEVWIGVSWGGLGVDDIVYVRFSTSNKKSGEYFVYASHGLVWGPNASWDVNYIYTYDLISLPTVSTDPATAIEAEIATSNGNITDNGGEDCDKRGFVYNTSPHGDPGDTAPADSEYSNYVEETNSFGTGAFTGALTSLEPKTTYYVRAYAHNSVGYSYGNEVSFTTLAALPTVSTQEMTDVEPTTATGNGNVTDLGGESLTQHGHCWSTSHNPTTSDDKTELGAKGETGAFTSSLTGLTPNTLYYCRAYATNSAGTSYGSEVTFTTEVDMAEVTTNEATNVKETSATLNGTLDDDGGEACDVRFQYGFTTSYGTNTDWQSGKETEDTFSQAIAELVGGTLYHFRAQARNSAGTVNGNDRSLTTITPFVAKRAHALSREEL